MWKDYLITAFRSIKHNMGNSLIAMIGFIIGILSVSAAILYMSYEFSYDTFHPFSGRTARIILERKQLSPGGEKEYRSGIV